jgi:hypothetical protein
MAFIQLPFGLPRVTKDGEILNSHAQLGCEIGHGRHGTAFEGRLNGEKVCFKKHYSSLSNAFISNPAKHEYGRLVQARKDLCGIADSLQAPRGWYNHPTIGAVLVTTLVQDYNGGPSQSLKETPWISESFLKQLEGVFKHIADGGMLYNPTPGNILVQKTSPTESRPVLIDLTNYESYLHYPAKAVAYLLSSANKGRQIAKWLEATLDVARGKVEGGYTASLDELRMPPPESPLSS